MPAFGSPLTAVETKTRSPHTTGLETAIPGTGVFQSRFSPLATSHFNGVGCPSATPDALGPLNDGQFWAEIAAPVSTHTATTIAFRMIYLPSTLVHRVTSFGKPTAVTLSPSMCSVSVTPGASATPNVVASRATNVSRCVLIAPVRLAPDAVKTSSAPPGPLKVPTYFASCAGAVVNSGRGFAPACSRSATISFLLPRVADASASDSAPAGGGPAAGMVLAG